MKIKILKAITCLALAFAFLTFNINAQQTDIDGPTGSGRFGSQVMALPNGNIVITDPDFNNPALGQSIGAVYLYNGSTGALISTLTGSNGNDRVGSEKIIVLSNGNFIVRSPNWDGSAIDVGAVTFGDKSTGVSGVVSLSNSLVGSTANDQVGKDVSFVTGRFYDGVVALTNGNYVVTSTNWDNSGVVDAGAVTFGNGTSGTSGVVSAANSLVGSTASDQVGIFGITLLTNGNYVVNSIFWNNGALIQAGAVTFGNGTTGVSGVITSSNSLIGNVTGDQIGNPGVTALTNGNYVIASKSWDSPAGTTGAVTFANGTTGITGFVTAANSLTGSASGGSISAGLKVTALTNGNYVVVSTFRAPDGASVGAATFGNGTTGVTGEVSTSNSLYGNSQGNDIGSGGVTALTNGNYVVISPKVFTFVPPSTFNNDAGAVTFCNGTTGTIGAISLSNSLYGTQPNNQLGNGGVTALTNGNYVVNSPHAFSYSGAATWGNGTTGVTGLISTSNSMVGGPTCLSGGCRVSSSGTVALSNGNYVVVSPGWDDPSASAYDVGAVTWGNGSTGTIGTVSSSNSLIGSQSTDQIGFNGVTALTNGNYVVSSQWWDDGATADVGAVTFGDGTNGTNGAVSASNSLVGSTFEDRVGFDGSVALANGHYAIWNRWWDDGAVVDAGSITYISGVSGNFSQASSKLNKRSTFLQTSSDSNNLVIDMTNSFIGTTAGEGHVLNISFDQTNNQIVIGRPTSSVNKVTLFKRFAPTAANVSVSGRVQTGKGRGIPRAIVSITDSTGVVRTARVNQFGYFKFESVEAGDNYIINASAKGYSFAPQVLNIDDDVRSLEITSN